MGAYSLQNFNTVENLPPLPSKEGGYVEKSGNDDTYFLKSPDSFYRPWLAVPGGSAFVWPGGVEGFTLVSNAQTGIIHYLGSIETTVDLIYPDEFHITLSGTFLGKTSVANKNALRSLILQPSTQRGKILALPGLESQLLYVAVINHQFTHDQNDSTNNISYSIEFIKTGTDGDLKNPPLEIPAPTPLANKQARGKSQHRVTVRANAQTLRAISTKVYGNSNQASLNKLINLNTDILYDHGVTSFKAASIRLPLGMTLEY